jgi:hypothetical protein
MKGQVSDLVIAVAPSLTPRNLRSQGGAALSGNDVEARRHGGEAEMGMLRGGPPA